MSESDRRLRTLSPPFFKGLKKILGKLELEKEKSDCFFILKKAYFVKQNVGMEGLLQGLFSLTFLPVMLPSNDNNSPSAPLY